MCVEGDQEPRSKSLIMIDSKRSNTKVHVRDDNELLAPTSESASHPTMISKLTSPSCRTSLAITSFPFLEDGRSKADAKNARSTAYQQKCEWYLRIGIPTNVVDSH
ncbi:hypothetical protein HGRIS_014081 [Hohenbuehelia grisea]|uniref:Uncharacterized protein n=1 Tax=Hohenbuehelia grisea TaxID=104357 RepID=A0ABR3JSB9_9AGAR